MSLATFAAQAVANYQQTAALVPSSRSLARAMVHPLVSSKTKRVLELGPGTGVLTEHMLEVLAPDARLISLELSPLFCDYLRERIPDSRLSVVNADAENAGRELNRLGWERVDAVVSSLGLGFMPDEQLDSIFRGLMPFLDEQSVLTQFQYVHSMRVLDGRLRPYSVRRFLKRYFETVERRIVWRNLPPAWVFDCCR